MNSYLFDRQDGCGKLPFSMDSATPAGAEGEDVPEVTASALTVVPARGIEIERWALLNDRLAACDPQDQDALRDAIAWVYEAIADTPEWALQDFDTFSEAMVAKDAIARADEVAQGTVMVAEDSDLTAALRDAAVLLRALELNFSEFGRYIESDIDEELERQWQTTDGRHYVIPRLTPLALIDGKPFLRRALRDHRVIPTNVKGFAVRLHRSTTAFDAAHADEERGVGGRRYGAALFPGLSIKKVAAGDKLFLVDALTGFDAIKMVDVHLDQAEASQCRALVWGELTMPKERVDQVSDRMSGMGRPASSLQYVIAGSWHRTVGGKMRNVAQVLDGCGQPLFEIYKWAKFKIDSDVEAIEAGREVHLLIAEDELVLIAICRDFLQETGDVPYRYLNVDTAIVPSMTGALPDAATMTGHAATANTLRVRYGTRTLVVAQPAYAAKGAVGEILALPEKPLREGSVAVHDAFFLCTLETL